MDRSLSGIEFKIHFPCLIKTNLKINLKTKTFPFSLNTFEILILKPKLILIIKQIN